MLYSRHLRRSGPPAIFLTSLLLGCVLLVCGAPSAFATLGVFQGKVVEGSKREAGTYIYVQGRNGMLRRVNIRSARVRFAEAVAPREKVAKPSEYLLEGAEVLVSAEQNNAGEWQAKEITILRLPRVQKQARWARPKAQASSWVAEG
jgi:hypothetical protein